MLVKGLNSAYIEPLKSFIQDSFQLSWEVNSTREIQFTAYDDGSLAYSMLDSEASVYFDGQEYIVKQFEPSYAEGLTTVQVTATHVFTEVSRIRLRTSYENVNYLPGDILKLYLSGNALGFTYRVVGTFKSVSVDSMGNNSATEALSLITDSWPGAVIYADNREIIVYSADEWESDLGNRIDYLHNSKEVQMTSDSSSIVNQVLAIGAEMEIEEPETDDESTDDTTDTYESDEPVYYFQPFIVEDAESVAKWGIHPGDDVTSDTIKDVTTMRQYALSQMTPQPSLSIDATMEGDFEPTPGEMRRLEIRDTGFVTTVQVVAYTWYPFSSAQDTSIMLNNTSQSILNYQQNQARKVNQAVANQQKQIGNLVNKVANTVNLTTGSAWTSEEVAKFGK